MKPLTDKTVKQLIFFNLFLSVALFGCFLYFAVVFKRGMEWNRDLHNRQDQLEYELSMVKARVDGNKMR
ncbi:hypothetical protein CCB81_12985 [Armatimonadetes bacterium Uphvl-Ar2]|nr:hypothetical protein CCB81_12985 [Armatimonadetes bacterium Uphvl-Ar2]